MKEANVLKAYEIAKEQFAGIGVDTEAAMKTLETVPISLHCWQGDDVGGFETARRGSSPEAAYRPPAIIRARRAPSASCAWISKRPLSMIPGKHRLEPARLLPR